MDHAIYPTTEDRESWGHRPSGVLTGPAEGAAADPLFLEGILPQEEFLERLRFEKRRVDRLGNPLSMALFFLKLEKAEAVPGMLPLESLETVGDVTVRQVLKRWLDILGALIGLILFSPVMLITAMAIKLTSPGPIIFRQTRLGRRGNPFDLLKFRSMTDGNDNRVHREYVFNRINGKYDQVNRGNRGDSLYNLKNDSRISPVGKIIRKLSLDQLPQFFNVLKGEMSLVGPRPPSPHEVEKFKSWHLRRILAVKPGITGLWQVEGHSPSSLDEMIRLDLRYVQNWSLWLDFEILGKTVLELWTAF